MKRFFPSVLIAVVLSTVYQAPAHAYSNQTLFTKLGRGLMNIIASPMEIVIQPRRMAQVDNHKAAAFIGGPAQGIYFMLGRITSGIYDLVTFPLPIPKHYDPIFFPENVWESFDDIDAGVWPYPRWGFDLFGEDYPKRSPRYH